MHVAQVRACAREGILEARRGPRGEYRLSFRDMIVLRRARSLMDAFPAARVRRVFRTIRRGLPERQLASLEIVADRDTIVVRDGPLIWEPESGQTCFNFGAGAGAPRVTPLPVAPGEEQSDEADADGAEAWLEVGLELETSDLDEAVEAYRRAVTLDPSLDEARTNLGRLLHARGEHGAAELQYRKALESNPGNAIAAFNLGVLLEDMNRVPDAVRAYMRTLEIEPDSADAHYNLYRIHERTGRTRQALRHLQAFRDLEGN